MGLISQIRRTFVKAGDPRREVRIDQYALHVEHALRTQRDKFDLDEVLGAIGCRQNEIHAIISRVTSPTCLRCSAVGDLEARHRDVDGSGNMGIDRLLAVMAVSPGTTDSITSPAPESGACRNQ